MRRLRAGAAPDGHAATAVAGIDPRVLGGTRQDIYAPVRRGLSATSRWFAPCSAPFVPYLAYVPGGFFLEPRASPGGGVYSARPPHVRCKRQSLERSKLDGRLAIRRHSKHRRRRPQDGCRTARRLSPPITGFTGMGIDGVGWGTGVTRRQRLGNQLRRQDLGHGLQRPTGGERIAQCRSRTSC